LHAAKRGDDDLLNRVLSLKGRKMTLIIVLLIFIVGWELMWQLLGVKPMLPWRFKKMLETQSDNYTLVDVRTPLEYEWFHIDGARNLPELLRNPEPLEPAQREAPVVVICMSGHRSPIAAYRLKSLGYTKVYNLTWGMLGWIASGGPTVKEQK
jgi:rhodanese-related sulfurtransferase